ncbi:hypothetical protein DPEC_G00363590 [Dallia pectoralis]|nr:hypothetical protein DPEC_G00363590 [Dallia pectoralis]
MLETQVLLDKLEKRVIKDRPENLACQEKMEIVEHLASQWTDHLWHSRPSQPNSGPTPGAQTQPANQWTDPPWHSRPSQPTSGPTPRAKWKDP